MPTRCDRWFLLVAQHVSGTIMPIIRSSRVLNRRLLPVVFGALVFKLSVWCGAEGYVSGLRAATATGSNRLYNTLELLMMGIMVPETCWASSKICIKNHLLHLVGILFPHINDDARSKSLTEVRLWNWFMWLGIVRGRARTRFFLGGGCGETMSSNSLNNLSEESVLCLFSVLNGGIRFF
jgi:hypothetical protein